MPDREPGKIRNVAVIGHRGTGKTSLVEALLYESGALDPAGQRVRQVDRLGLRRGGAQRGMSISSAVTHLSGRTARST